MSAVKKTSSLNARLKNLEEDIQSIIKHQCRKSLVATSGITDHASTSTAVPSNGSSKNKTVRRKLIPSHGSKTLVFDPLPLGREKSGTVDSKSKTVGSTFRQHLVSRHVTKTTSARSSISKGVKPSSLVGGTKSSSVLKQEVERVPEVTDSDSSALTGSCRLQKYSGTESPSTTKDSETGSDCMQQKCCRKHYVTKTVEVEETSMRKKKPQATTLKYKNKIEELSKVLHNELEKRQAAEKAVAAFKEPTDVTEMSDGNWTDKYKIITQELKGEKVKRAELETIVEDLRNEYAGKSKDLAKQYETVFQNLKEEQEFRWMAEQNSEKMRHALEEHRTQIAEMLESKKEAVTQIAQLREKYESVHRARQEALLNMDKLKAESSELSRQLCSEALAKSQFSLELEALQRRVEEAAQERDGLRDRVDQAEAAIAEKESQIKSLTTLNPLSDPTVVRMLATREQSFTELLDEKNRRESMMEAWSNTIQKQLKAAMAAERNKRKSLEAMVEQMKEQLMEKADQSMKSPVGLSRQTSLEKEAEKEADSSKKESHQSRIPVQFISRPKSTGNEQMKDSSKKESLQSRKSPVQTTSRQTSSEKEVEQTKGEKNEKLHSKTVTSISRQKSTEKEVERTNDSSKGEAVQTVKSPTKSFSRQKSLEKEVERIKDSLDKEAFQPRKSHVESLPRQKTLEEKVELMADSSNDIAVESRNSPVKSISRQKSLEKEVKRLKDSLKGGADVSEQSPAATSVSRQKSSEKEVEQMKDSPKNKVNQPKKLHEDFTSRLVSEVEPSQGDGIQSGKATDEQTARIDELTRANIEFEAIIKSLRDTIRLQEEQVRVVKEEMVLLQMRVPDESTWKVQEVQLEKLCADLECERDKLLVQKKIVEDQAGTIAELKRALVDKAEQMQMICRERAILELQLEQERNAKEEAVYMLKHMEARKDHLKTCCMELERELANAEGDSVHHKHAVMLSQLEKQVEEKQQKWDLQVSQLCIEKEQALKAAQFATQKLVRTMADFQKEMATQKRVRTMLATVIKDKEKQLLAAHSKVKLLAEHRWVREPRSALCNALLAMAQRPPRWANTGRSVLRADCTDGTVSNRQTPVPPRQVRSSESRGP